MDTNCVLVDKYTIFGVDILIHVLILFTILSMFFMFYSSGLEKKELNGQIQDNVSRGMDDVMKSLNPEQKARLAYMGETKGVKALQEKWQVPDEAAEINNKWLFHSITFTDIALFLLVLTVVTLLLFHCNKCLDIKHILLVNVITFIFIGIVEYLFFRNVGLKFIPTLPSTISQTFFTTLRQNLGR